MARKGCKATKAEREAGACNLAEWKKKNPSGGRLSHGAYSKIVRKKYDDSSTREARWLKPQIDSLIADLEPTIPAQKQIIGRIAEKLITLKRIGDYIEAQADSIIDDQGSAIPCINTYLRYSASLLRDLDLLYKKI